MHHGQRNPMTSYVGFWQIVLQNYFARPSLPD
jgi:hypothetical protein